MHSRIVLLFGLLTVAVNAHFQLQFPTPRGVFVEDDEPKFCDGYNTAVPNRTVFPLSGGFFTLNSEHAKWTAGVLVSTAANPTSFANFSQSNGFFQVQGEGAFCIPLDFSKSNVTGLTDGQNVTLQIQFSGGDGSLFQCSDLTLSSSAKIASSVTCTNATGSSGGSSGGGGSTGGSSTNSSGTSGGSKPQSSAISTYAAPLMIISGLTAVAALLVL